MIKSKRGMSAWVWILIILIVVGIGVYFWFFSGGGDGGILSRGNSIPQPPALPN